MTLQYLGSGLNLIIKFFPTSVTSVVIPTRNREKLLRGLIERLTSYETSFLQVIVIDSSDKPIEIDETLKFPFELIYRHTLICSAAYQRNLGLRLVNADTRYIAFLDDDVIPGDKYFESLIQTLETHSGIGISGIAVDHSIHKTQRFNDQFAFKFKKIFGLAGTKRGAVLHSGVAIPVSENSSEIVFSNWLIGCSIWKFSSIKRLRFENFVGQSLAEDVIFSMRANSLGRLIVDPSVIFDHSQEVSGRPNSFNFWRMWVTNRRRLIQLFQGSGMSYRGFYLANFGQLLIQIFKMLGGNLDSGKGALGIVVGMFSKTRYVDED
jgi:glycosyltransferase involved in cell wall biosynthesis